MKKMPFLVLAFVLFLTACGRTYTCTDPLGCVAVERGAPISITALLTLSGPDAPYGIDALRGAEIAVADRGDVLGHPIELKQEDDLCSAEGGKAGAERIVQNPQIVGVIGTTCSSASTTAAKLLTEAGMVMISPSSTAASLTDEATHQAGFLRTIYNDKAQASMVANFAYDVLAARRMGTIHDGTPYSMELQEEACSIFESLGGLCLEQFQLDSGTSPLRALIRFDWFDVDVAYFPLYTTDGVNVTNRIREAGLENIVRISSDGLISSDFLEQVGANAEGMYFSGPSTLKIDPSFYEKYQTRYNEEPIAVYAAQAYDAVVMLFDAIERAAVIRGGTLYIPRQGLREALYATRNLQGLSGTLTCSDFGDCAAPNIVIYEARGGRFVAIYP